MLESSADLLQIIWSRILVEITLPCSADGVAVARVPSRGEMVSSLKRSVLLVPV